MKRWGDQLHSFFELATDGEPHWDLISPSFVELQNVDEKYSQQELLGAGALKEVYKCYDRKTRRHIALAKLREDLNEDFYEAFIYEAWLTTSLSHPNIIKVFEVELDTESRPYFTMDLKANQTLEQVIEEGVSQKELLETFLTVCDAVSYAHDRGVIHLDLKPSNIQCDQFGEVLVCDWGLGKYLDSEEVRRDPLSHLEAGGMVTMYGYIKGTPGYMAPEQIHAEMPKDERADVFALGAILYTIVCGEPPFTGEVEECLERTLKGASRENLMASPIPKGIVDICAKALSAQPEERYQSVRDLRQDVQRYSEGYVTRAERPDYLRYCLLFLKRHHRSVIAGSVFLILLMTGIGIQQRRVQREQESRALSERQVTTLSEEVDELTYEYEVFASAMADSKKSLSIKLVRTANDLIQDALGRDGDEIGPEMVILLREAELLLEKACDVYEVNRAAVSLLRHVNIVQRDMVSLLDLGQEPMSEKERRFYNVANRLNDRKALGAKVSFTDYIDALADDWALEDRASVEAMLLYELVSNSHTATRNESVKAVLDYFNHQEPSYQSSYNSTENTLSLYSDGRLVYSTTMNQKRLLSYLSLDQLSVGTGQNYGLNLCDLNGMRVEVLDCTRVCRLYKNGELSVNGLRKILLHERERNANYVKELQNAGVRVEFSSSDN